MGSHFFGQDSVRVTHKGVIIAPSVSVKVKVLVTPSSPTLCDPMDYSLPGSSVHGILQARIVEWIAISLSRGSSRLNLHLLHWQVDSLPLSHQESPRMAVVPINFANLDKLHNLSCCCSVAQSCPTLCHPMDCSMPGVPVLHHLPEPAQTHVH